MTRSLFLPLTLSLGILSAFSATTEKAPDKNTLNSRPAPAEAGVTVAADDLIQRGNELYNKGEYAKALILYKRAEQRGSDPAAAAFNQGNCLFRLNRFSEAAAAFRKAVRLSQGNLPAAQLNLAAVLFRLEQYGEAIGAYRRVLRDDPDNIGAWLYLADAYVRVKDYIGALQAMEKARALDPADVSLVYQTAEIHAALKEYDKAVVLVREAYARKPSEVDFLFYIGDLRRAQGNLSEAAAAYREGLSHRENDVDALYKLSDALAQDGKPFLAMDYLQKALAIKPEFTDAAVFLGNLAFDAKWWERSENAYRQAVQNGSKEGLEGLRNLAYELHRQGRNDDAAALLDRTLALRPKEADLKAEAAEYRELAKSAKPGR
jgi:tetratricopeptide (TPR) repeat protein